MNNSIVGNFFAALGLVALIISHEEAVKTESTQVESTVKVQKLKQTKKNTDSLIAKSMYRNRTR